MKQRKIIALCLLAAALALPGCGGEARPLQGQVLFVAAQNVLSG